MSQAASTHIRPAYQPLLRHLNFCAEWVFESPLVIVWRKLSDRENCTVDTRWPDGRAVRLHVKRYPKRFAKMARDEAKALGNLENAGIACAPLVAWGERFIITEDLAGFEAADKLIERGAPFERMLIPTAELAARLHQAGLHHRDLYLCHFFARLNKNEGEFKLIDAARVRRLPPWPTTSRWIVKDLAQFWYSTLKLPITDQQRLRWLEHYSNITKLKPVEILRRRIERKILQIGAHDVKLNERQPNRHVSLNKSNP